MSGVLAVVEPVKKLPVKLLGNPVTVLCAVAVKIFSELNTML